MFNTYAYTFIDTVQSGKKQFVNTFVKHEGIGKILNDFVDAQTKYTKSAFDAGYNATTNFVTLVSTPNFVNEIKDTVVDSVNHFVPDFLKTTKGKK